ISAVLSGVKEIRMAIEQAQEEKRYHRRTILFVDEVHRFNKAQQDAFLPYVEDGTLIFIGATTENPSFELNNALLSRARVYVLKPLTSQTIEKILMHALQFDEELKAQRFGIDEVSLASLAAAADGDARRALNLLEMATGLAASRQQSVIDGSILADIAQQDVRRFDKGGDIFHEQISALHKAVRGSS